MNDGDRIIQLYPQRHPGQRWEGYLVGDEHERRWSGGSCQHVEDSMNADLGPLPPGQDYRVVEGGA